MKISLLRIDGLLLASLCLLLSNGPPRQHYLDEESDLGISLGFDALQSFSGTSLLVEAGRSGGGSRSSSSSSRGGGFSRLFGSKPKGSSSGSSSGSAYPRQPGSPPHPPPGYTNLQRPSAPPPAGWNVPPKPSGTTGNGPPPPGWNIPGGSLPSGAGGPPLPGWKIPSSPSGGGSGFIPSTGTNPLSSSKPSGGGLGALGGLATGVAASRLPGGGSSSFSKPKYGKHGGGSFSGGPGWVPVVAGGAGGLAAGYAIGRLTSGGSRFGGLGSGFGDAAPRLYGGVPLENLNITDSVQIVKVIETMNITSIDPEVLEAIRNGSTQVTLQNGVLYKYDPAEKLTISESNVSQQTTSSSTRSSTSYNSSYSPVLVFMLLIISLIVVVVLIKVLMKWMNKGTKRFATQAAAAAAAPGGDPVQPVPWNAMPASQAVGPAPYPHTVLTEPVRYSDVQKSFPDDAPPPYTAVAPSPGHYPPSMPSMPQMPYPSQPQSTGGDHSKPAIGFNVMGP